MAANDEVKKLRDQIQKLEESNKKLEERVDYISGIVPQCVFLQDYHNKMESEANMHLTRWKKQKLGNIGEESNSDTAELEMQRWLTVVTDAVMELKQSVYNDGSKDRNLAARPTAAQSWVPPVERPSSPKTLGGSGYPSITVQPAKEPSREVYTERSREKPTKENSSQNFLLRPTEGSSPPSRDGSAFLASPDPHDRPRHGASFEEPGRLRNLQEPPRDYHPSGGHPTLGGTYHKSATVPVPNADRLRFSEDDGSAEPLAEPGIGAPEHIDGIMLGKGSWATSYRQASGQRREALRLLCRSGIVTARELADDNTVISEEHIDECVSIGLEMLHTRNMDQWTRSPNEAKQVFEARLTSLYQKKFGEQQQQDKD